MNPWMTLFATPRLDDVIELMFGSGVRLRHDVLSAGDCGDVQAGDVPKGGVPKGGVHKSGVHKGGVHKSGVQMGGVHKSGVQKGCWS